MTNEQTGRLQQWAVNTAKICRNCERTPNSEHKWELQFVSFSGVDIDSGSIGFGGGGTHIMLSCPYCGYDHTFKMPPWIMEPVQANAPTSSTIRPEA